MNPSKPVNPIRSYAVRSAITVLVLLSPVIAYLMSITTEALIDLLIAAGPTTVCAVSTGAVGLVLFRKFWRRAYAAVEGSDTSTASV
jgi:hypothetical protein